MKVAIFWVGDQLQLAVSDDVQAFRPSGKQLIKSVLHSVQDNRNSAFTVNIFREGPMCVLRQQLSEITHHKIRTKLKAEVFTQ